MDDLKLREMREGDWPAVSRIYQMGMDTNIATFQTECPSWDEWDSSHLKECRIVAEADGGITGWAALTTVSSRCVYTGVAEVSVYVDPAHQGAGVGSALLKELCSISQEYGYWTLQSGIMQNNPASIRLHEKAGFRIVGYREKIGKDRNGTWRNTVLMERRNTIE